MLLQATDSQSPVTAKWLQVLPLITSKKSKKYFSVEFWMGFNVTPEMVLTLKAYNSQTLVTVVLKGWKEY